MTRSAPIQPGDQGITLLGVTERLLAGAAIAGATIYVLINSLYVEFYDDFGVRPEDVGWDRLTVLSRAAWIALVGIPIVGAVGYLFARLTTRRVLEHDLSEAEQQRQRRSLRRARTRRLLGAASISFTILVLSGFLWVEDEVEKEAANTKRGESGNGISLLVPFIDVRTTRARVTWLEEDGVRPRGLDEPHLIYLGHGEEFAVFVACGRATIYLPIDKISIDLMLNEADLPDDQQRERFSAACSA